MSSSKCRGNDTIVPLKPNIQVCLNALIQYMVPPMEAISPSLIAKALSRNVVRVIMPLFLVNRIMTHRLDTHPIKTISPIMLPEEK